MTKKYIPAPNEAARARSVSALRLGLIILALSLLTHFTFFGQPAETVFDEVHFGKFVSGYFTGEYYFDIHPPLGKLIIASMLKIRAFLPRSEPEVLLPGAFETIGQKFTDNVYQWLRFLPRLAGTLLPLVIFLIALELGVSQKFAFLAGLLAVFENSILTQSRFILLDSFLLLFGFLALLFYLKSKTQAYNYKLLFLAGIFAVLAASIKWTGFSFLGLILIFYFIKSFDYTAYASKSKFLFKGFVLLIITPFLIYFSIFTVHFLLLDKPGPGLAFHQTNFQEMNVFKKFVELNIEIYASNARLTAPHPYSSQWYTWPFMTRSIYYWMGDQARIYLLGNPLIYWLSTVAVVYFTINYFKNRRDFSYSFLTAGYWLNLLPFIFIGRVMFLYHYFTSLIFAIMILAFVMDKAEFKHKKTAFNAILAGSIILFLFFSPLTYGLAVPEWYYKLTVWLPSWK